MESKNRSSKKIKMQECAEGVRCNNRNVDHFEKFAHQHLTDLLQTEEIEIPENFPEEKTIYIEQVEILRSLLYTNMTMSEKLENAKPYNLFFSKIPKLPETLTPENCITFRDLLCPSLGVLKCSLQFNFLVDFEWLIEQYRSRNLDKTPITVLYGKDEENAVEVKLPKNVTKHVVRMGHVFGHHHSKLGLYVYKDQSLRVVVSTANLFYQDWNNQHQGVWISPPCPKLPEESEVAGESLTNFKRSLLTYLRHYNLTILNPWIEYVKNADFSAVQVFLVMSVPGTHYPKTPDSHLNSHLNYVGHLLSNHCTFSGVANPDTWGIIAQASSVATLGESPTLWWNVLLRKLSGEVDGNQTMSIIFPSEANVKNGVFGSESGKCLSCCKNTTLFKQKWALQFFYQWKADKLGRTKAMPHIKTYCRISPDLKKMAWFLMTSANISKSAWGGRPNKRNGVNVLSYEVGVMFLPEFFDQDFFQIDSTKDDENLFPFIYDLPLTKYENEDFPYCSY